MSRSQRNPSSGEPPEKKPKSFGPLGTLIRQHRIAKKLALIDVARACQCSVQFISNIEHGRAPLPWDKVESLAKVLGISYEELQAANLSVRSDFKIFAQRSGAAAGEIGDDIANFLTLITHDANLRQTLESYRKASPQSRQRFLEEASRLLQEGSGSSNDE